MHKLLELRATHSRKKILSLLLEEHIFRRDVEADIDPAMTTFTHLEATASHVNQDLERYIRSGYATQSDSGEQLISLLGSMSAPTLEAEGAVEIVNGNDKMKARTASSSRRTRDGQSQIRQLQASAVCNAVAV
jgi:hypothetical protein